MLASPAIRVGAAKAAAVGMTPCVSRQELRAQLVEGGGASGGTQLMPRDGKRPAPNSSSKGGAGSSTRGPNGVAPLQEVSVVLDEGATSSPKARVLEDGATRSDAFREVPI